MIKEGPWAVAWPFMVLLGCALMVIFGLVIGVPSTSRVQYYALRHKSPKYYQDLSAAFDSVVAGSPLGTNTMKEISVTEPSLPKIITDLHPVRIIVQRRGVVLALGSNTRAGFGLAWQAQYEQTNIWVLRTMTEGKDTVLYSAWKTSPTSK